MLDPVIIQFWIVQDQFKVISVLLFINSQTVAVVQCCIGGIFSKGNHAEYVMDFDTKWVRTHHQCILVSQAGQIKHDLLLLD